MKRIKTQYLFRDYNFNEWVMLLGIIIFVISYIFENYYLTIYCAIAIPILILWEINITLKNIFWKIKK